MSSFFPNLFLEEILLVNYDRKYCVIVLSSLLKKLCDSAWFIGCNEFWGHGSLCQVTSSEVAELSSYCVVLDSITLFGGRFDRCRYHLVACGIHLTMDLMALWGNFSKTAPSLL